VVFYVFLLDSGTVPTVWYFIYHTVGTVPESNIKTKYHTVGTVPESYRNT
jgi:hypothetical protein